MNYFFMHIPKTAGEMVIHCLRKDLGQSKILMVHNDSQRKEFFNNSESNINEYEWVMGHIALWEFEKVIDSISTWKIFTIMRDPYQRFISQYKYLYYSDHPDHKKYKSMDFEKYLEIYHTAWPDLLCYMFSSKRTPGDAFEEIKKRNVAVYYLEMLEQLEADLSIFIGSDIKFDKVLNKSRPVDVDFSKYRNRIEDLVAKDKELYEACRSATLCRLV